MYYGKATLHAILYGMDETQRTTALNALTGPNIKLEGVFDYAKDEISALITFQFKGKAEVMKALQGIIRHWVPATWTTSQTQPVALTKGERTFCEVVSPKIQQKLKPLFPPESTYKPVWLNGDIVLRVTVSAIHVPELVYKSGFTTAPDFPEKVRLTSRYINCDYEHAESE